MNCDVKGSGNSPSIAVAAVFAPLGANRNLLQESTILPQVIRFCDNYLTALHGLAYISHGTISTSKITPRL
ncbi:hypothetical protein GQ600_3431 [Phytophthora cactorum]|nr:hypothetical protein GQ600_3431 [Phytophthora cactorum]